jgi:DNA (cytosine-5)-methyltransferase 1
MAKRGNKNGVKSKPPLYTVAELFCGCGGFSHGFKKTGRFLPVFGNDVKRFALETFRHNHGAEENTPTTLQQDIRTVSDDDLIRAIESKGVSSLDCLIGGPPCQGFSQMRRTEARSGSKIVRFGGYNKLDQDPRNDLVLRFLEVAAALEPKVVVIENVPQFLRHYHDGQAGGIAQQVEEVLEDLGYEVECDVLNAADYGVPQLRQRAVIIASRVGHISLPKPTHFNPSELGLRGRRPWVTVGEAIGDLPAKAPLDEVLGGQRDGYAGPAPSDFAKSMRTSPAFPYNHVTRQYEDRILALIAQMRPGETWDDASARMQSTYERLIAKAKKRGEGEAATRTRLIEDGRIISTFYKDYYWSAYTRLAVHEPALTITANANFLGSGRFTHPSEQRGITMREAARLQSFDDAFTFLTSNTVGKLTSNVGVGMDMIGEAVPPLLAQRIADVIAQHLDMAARD